jgi:hypothetical protein
MNMILQTVQRYLLIMYAFSLAFVVPDEWLRRRPKAAIFVAFFAVFVALLLLSYLVTLLLPSFLYTHRFWSDVLSSHLLLIPTIFIACALYRIRGTHPVAYGIVEILTGIATISFVISASPFGDITAKVLGLIGGVYVIVRGLDNANKGIPDEVRYWWRVGFGFPPKNFV